MQHKRDATLTIGFAMARRVRDLCHVGFSAFARARDVDSVDLTVSMYVRRLNTFSLIVGTLVLALALRRWLEGAVTVAAIEASSVGLMQIVRLLVVRKPTMPKIRVALHASIALGMWIIVGSAMVLGQLQSPSLLCLGLAPLAGGYVGGRHGRVSGTLGWGLLIPA